MMEFILVMVIGMVIGVLMLLIGQTSAMIYLNHKSRRKP